MKKNASNKDIAVLLRYIAAAYILKNENKFKIIAYQKAADTVEHLARELHDIWQEGKVKSVPGLGPSISGHLDEYFTTGESKHFNTVLGEIPAPVFALMKVPSLGAKTAFKLVQTLELSNADTAIEDLEQAAKAGKIELIPTFGKRSQEEIIEAIHRYKNSDHQKGRMLISEAYEIAGRVMEYLRQNPHVKRIDALGSLRRMVPTIGDVDLCVQADSEYTQEILEYFTKYPGEKTIEGLGDKKASIILFPNTKVDCRVEDEKSYGSMLQYFTGSKAHNIKLREFALCKDLSLNEYGIKSVKTGEVAEFSDEKGFYNYLGLEYVPPEIREGTNEIDISLKKKVPVLVELSDVKGDLQMHSSYDLKPSHDLGTHTYVEMLQKAHELGYQYIGFTDHNPKSSLSEEEIVEIMKKRKHDIDEMIARSKIPMKYFISLETDITPTGEIAHPEKAIEYVDYLLISVHSQFNLNMEDMTKRVLKAMAYPKVKIIGHPTGRLLEKRPGFELNWEQIFTEAKKRDIAIEINASPMRLDLPDTLVREGLTYGVKFAIDTDAHHMDQLENMRYGVAVARRGWRTRGDIVNTMEYNDIRGWLTG